MGGGEKNRQWEIRSGVKKERRKRKEEEKEGGKGKTLLVF